MIGEKSGGTEKERGTGKIAGDSCLDAVQSLPAANPHFVSLPIKPGAKGAQRHFAVIPRSERLFNASIAFSQKPANSRQVLTCALATGIW